MSVKPPCPSCPWRVKAQADSIPNFRLDFAEDLAGTCLKDQGADQLGAPIFACHHSHLGREFPCAGWLALYGYDNIQIRFMVLNGKISVDALEPGAGWPELHKDYEEMMEKLRGEADAHAHH